MRKGDDVGFGMCYVLCNMFYVILACGVQVLNEQGGDNQQQHTRQFRGLRQVSQRVVSPMNLRNVILYVILLEKKHEGRFFGIPTRMAGLMMPLN